MLDINELIKSAMKSKDEVKLNAYKNIKVEIQKNQTAKGAKPLTDELQLQIISKYAKSLEDAAKQFLDAGREDLAAEYTEELIEVNKLLPEPVDESQLEGVLARYCFDARFMKSEQNEAVSSYKCQIPKKEMGKVIKYLKSKFPIADGKMISEIVKKYIV